MIVGKIIENVLESDSRFMIELKEAFDMMLSAFKRIFKDALRTDQMITGDTIVDKSRSEQLDIICLLMTDLLEMLTNFQLITAHFGPQVMVEVATVTFMVYLTNAYCLVRKIRKTWLPVYGNETMVAVIQGHIDSVCKLTVTVMASVLNSLLSRIG